IEYSIPAEPEKYADCAKAMGAAQQNDSVESANAKLIEALKDINTSLQVPTLEAFGADKQYFDEVVNTMAEQALASGSPSNNPRLPTKEEIVKLYQQLWS
ncbi:MAG: iron-containing alcohol dehydrogenase, partial [Acinetobacter guillouiae]